MQACHLNNLTKTVTSSGGPHCLNYLKMLFKNQKTKLNSGYTVGFLLMIPSKQDLI
jgi:hypothetical protein